MQKMPCINFGEVYYTMFPTLDTHSARGHASQTPRKAPPGWALIRVNFDSIQEIGPKVVGGHSFVSGRFFTRLQCVSACAFVRV